MADQRSVFDSMDELTAQLCLNLQLEDLAALDDAPTGSAQPPSDHAIALRLQEAEFRAYRADRGLPEPPAPPGPPTTCGSCLNDFPAEKCATLPCGHEYHDECLEYLFSQSMRDKTLYPPRCCRQTIPWETVRDVVSANLMAEFEAKQEELDDKDPVYCHDKLCSAYIKSAQKGAGQATCSTCGTATCTVCKQGTHDGACPEDEEVKKMREYAKEEGNQECSRCHQLVELTIGCNHITCLCKNEFCYCCGVEWKNCACATWDEDRLLARAGNVANREGMGGAAAAPVIAEQLRENHQACDDGGHGWMEKITVGDLECEGCNQVQNAFILRCYTCHTQLCVRCKNNRA